MLHKLTLVSLCLVFALSSFSAQQTNKSEISVPDVPYSKFVLQNGLTLIVHEDHKNPTVSVEVFYHVGSKNEKVGKTGFAHLYEHLMFAGSEHFKHTYLQAMEGIGATASNGTTNNDRTNFFETVPTSMLDYILFAESDRMGHLLGAIDQKKLDLQRGVVQNEKRQGEDRPYTAAYERVATAFPAGHPYSWPVIGSMEDLNAASLSDVQDWFKKYYGPTNVTLVVAGDISPKEAKEKVEKYFGEIPPGPPVPKHGSWIAKRNETQRDVIEERVPVPRILRSWNTPESDTREEALLDLAAYTLGGSQSARLHKRLVRKEKLATQVQAFNSTREIAGQFTIELDAIPQGDVKLLERITDEELQAFLKSGPTQSELQLAKTQILGSFVRNAESVLGKTFLLSRCQAFRNNPDCYKDYVSHIQRASAMDVKMAANTWLKCGDYIVETRPFPDELKATVNIDRSKEPIAGAPMQLHLPKLEHATLSNGMKLALVPRKGAGVLKIEVMFEGGRSVQGPNKDGVAAFTMEMLREGTKSRDATQIDTELEAQNATVAFGATFDWATATLDTLKDTLSQSLPIFADVLLNPRFDSADFERLRKARIAGIREEKVSPESLPFRVFPSLVFGKDHPYATAYSGLGSEQYLSKMPIEDIRSYYSAWVRPGNATVLVTGDISLREVTSLLEQYFGKWKSGTAPKAVIPNVVEPSKVLVYLLDRPGSEQSVIATAQLMPAPAHADSTALDIVNGVFGGAFGSRVNMNLREDKHWSYGVFTFFQDTRKLRSLISYAPVQKDKTAESFLEIAKEYRNIAGAKPISKDELQKMVDQVVLNLPGKFETVSDIDKGYGRIVQYDLPEDHYNTITSEILSLTPEKANDVAKKYLCFDNLIWLVIGDMSKVEKGIRALNIGEIRKIDADGNLQSN